MATINSRQSYIRMNIAISEYQNDGNNTGGIKWGIYLSLHSSEQIT